MVARSLGQHEQCASSPGSVVAWTRWHQPDYTSGGAQAFDRDLRLGCDSGDTVVAARAVAEILTSTRLAALTPIYHPPGV